jgi:hypothetical protein
MSGPFSLRAYYFVLIIENHWVSSQDYTMYAASVILSYRHGKGNPLWPVYRQRLRLICKTDMQEHIWKPCGMSELWSGQAYMPHGLSLVCKALPTQINLPESLAKCVDNSPIIQSSYLQDGSLGLSRIHCLQKNQVEQLSTCNNILMSWEEGLNKCKTEISWSIFFLMTILWH